MRQFPKVFPNFNEQYFYYNQLPIDKTVSFRLPSQLADENRHKKATDEAVIIALSVAF